MPKITMALSKPLSNTVSNYSARECLCVESQCLCDDFNLVCLCARVRGWRQHFDVEGASCSRVVLYDVRS